MRAIKFRAWDKEGNRFYDWNEIIDWCDFSWIFEKTKDEINWGTNRFIAEQYTGLKDNNGLEIYEGDKVIIKSDDEEVYTIEWHEDSARFVISGESVVFDFDNYYGHELKVIGNIHEGGEENDR